MSRRLALAASLALATSALLAVSGCAGRRSPADWAAVREVTPALLAGRAAADPALASDGRGHVALTFVTRDSAGGHDLWLALSHDSGARFDPLVRVNLVPGRVSSYAESRPVPVWGPGGRLAIAWSQLRADTGMVADLLVRSGSDVATLGAAALGPPVMVNDDSLGRPVYHGFPALAFMPDGALFAAWMDGRTHAEADAELLGALFSSVSADGGRTWSANALVTDSLCPCCRAAVASTGAGRLALSWRSAARGVRDPVLAFSSDSGRTFTPETPVSFDGWQLDACPSEGPVLIGAGERGTSVWTTGAEPAGVYLASWGFGHRPEAPRRALMDSLARAAHPRAVALGDATLLAVEALPKGDSVGVVAVRALEPGGALTPWVFLGAHAREAWPAAVGPRTALVAWVERESAGPRIRIARIERVAAPVAH